MLGNVKRMRALTFSSDGAVLLGLSQSFCAGMFIPCLVGCVILGTKWTKRSGERSRIPSHLPQGFCAEGWWGGGQQGRPLGSGPTQPRVLLGGRLKRGKKTGAPLTPACEKELHSRKENERHDTMGTRAPVAHLVSLCK